MRACEAPPESRRSPFFYPYMGRFTQSLSLIRLVYSPRAEENHNSANQILEGTNALYDKRVKQHPKKHLRRHQHKKLISNLFWPSAKMKSKHFPHVAQARKGPHIFLCCVSPEKGGVASRTKPSARCKPNRIYDKKKWPSATFHCLFYTVARRHRIHTARHVQQWRVLSTLCDIYMYEGIHVARSDEDKQWGCRCFGAKTRGLLEYSKT